MSKVLLVILVFTLLTGVLGLADFSWCVRHNVTVVDTYDSAEQPGTILFGGFHVCGNCTAFFPFATLWMAVIFIFLRYSATLLTPRLIVLTPPVPPPCFS